MELIKNSQHPYIESIWSRPYGTSTEGKLDPVVGREKEIEQVIQVLTAALKITLSHRRTRCGENCRSGRACSKDYRTGHTGDFEG